MTENRNTLVTKEMLNHFMETQFPQNRCVVEKVDAEEAVIRHKIGFNELRPGGTVAGPVMMLVADAALYVAILGRIGLVPLAVTTNLNINFLRKPAAERDIIGKCRLIKLGKVLAIGEVWVYSEGDDEPVAHATGTYSIPPQKN